ncbi:hypothetical protein [Brevibacillus sp. SYSU BS000544]|uniref:hypothetical protein n=1 Tax=Brevibacillus sp. SYSU BS000544 TaxID=3416443 RepID=UPI003CE48048
MITENDVIEAVCKHLVNQGFVIQQALNTNEKGDDIIAYHPKENVKILVEAKGETSSQVHTKRYGMPFTSNQRKTHVMQALYRCAKMQCEAKEHSNIKVGMAFPGDNIHRKWLTDIKDFLFQNQIIVFLVNQNKAVEQWM